VLHPKGRDIEVITFERNEEFDSDEEIVGDLLFVILVAWWKIC
jgi:hypothetical protein